MKMTKYMLAAFAVFASILMLMTPTMARPVAEKTTMDVVETAEQEVVDAMASLFANLESDVRLDRMSQQITSDGTLSQQEFDALNAYIQSIYSDDLSSVESQMGILLSELDENDPNNGNPEANSQGPFQYMIRDDGYIGWNGEWYPPGSPMARFIMAMGELELTLAEVCLFVFAVLLLVGLGLLTLSVLLDNFAGIVEQVSNDLETLSVILIALSILAYIIGSIPGYIDAIKNGDSVMTP